MLLMRVLSSFSEDRRSISASVLLFSVLERKFLKFCSCLLSVSSFVSYFSLVGSACVFEKKILKQKDRL